MFRLRTSRTVRSRARAGLSRDQQIAVRGSGECLNAARIALALAAIPNVFIVFVAADANQGYQMGSQIVLPIVRSASLAGISLLLLVALCRNWRTPDLLTVVLIAHAVVGTVLGVLFGNDYFLLARHLFASLTIAACYWLGALFSQDLLPLTKDMRVWSWATLVATLALFAFVGSTLGSLTTTTSPTPLLLTVGAGIVFGPLWVAVLATVLIILGNNRAAVIGLCVTFATFTLARCQSTRLGLRIALAAALTVVFFVAISLLVTGVNKVAEEIASYYDLENYVVLSERMMRLPESIRMLQNNSSQALDHYSSGRIIELNAVLQSLQSNTLKLLFGAGFGATFEFSYYSWTLKQVQNYIRHQPDVAVTYLLLTGGIVFGAAISVLFAYRLFWIFVAAVSGCITGTGVLFALGYSTSNLLGFVPNTPLVWLLIGVYWTAIARERPPLSEMRGKK